MSEKSARIRRSFVNVLGTTKAVPYCITGPRGEKKKIGLDREYVIWEKQEE